MGFPKKISQLPLNLAVKPEDLLVTVNENDVTTKVTLSQIIGFLTGGTNTFVTGGTYNNLTESIDFVGTINFPPFSVSLTGLSTTDTFVTGATLNGFVLEIDRNNGEPQITVDLSSLTGDTDTNTFVTGTTLVGDNYTINQNNGTSFTTDFNPIVSGKVDTILFDTYTANTKTDIDSKLDITTFDDYTANTTDNVVTGATLNGNLLELERNNGLSDVTVDLSSLTATTPTIDEVIAAGNQLTNTNSTLDLPLGGSIDWSTFGGQQNFYISNSSAASTYIRIVNKGGELEMDDSMISLASFAGKDLELKTGGNTDDFRIYLGTNGPSIGDVLEVKSLDGNTGLMGWATLPSDVFVNSGNANSTTQQLTFTNTTGGTFNVTNSAALFSDNDINVTGGTYNPTTGCITFDTNSGTTFDVCGFVTGFTDVYVTGSTLVGTNYTLTRTDNTTITTDFNPIVSGKVDTTLFDSYTANTKTDIDSKLNITTFDNYTANTTDNVVTGATLVGATLELERNNGLSDVTVDLSPLSGISENTFVTGTTLVGTNYTLERNDDVDITTDFNPIVSGKVDTTLFNTYSGSVQTQLDSKIENGINSGGANEVFSGKSGTDLYFRTISGGSNTTVSTIDDVIKVDVTIPPDTNTFVTGFTYNDANTFTISRNDDVSLNTTINVVTGLTVNGVFSASTYTGLTLNDLDDVTTNIPVSPDNTYQGELVYFDVASNQWVSGAEYGNLGEVTIWGKKGSAGTIDKGCPVYITGFDDDIHEVELANATTASTMPVIGFTAEDFDNAGVYPIVTFGKITGLDTSSATTVVNPFGETWEVNDVLYMAKTDGGLTKFRPSGTNTQIQRIAKVLKIGTIDGQLFIFNTARTAGLPNLTTDYLWLGNGNDTPQEVIRTDVGITTTGFTYNDNNTFTITDDNGGSLSSTINQMSGLTINGDLDVTGDTTLGPLTATSVTSNSAINVFNGHINLRDNSYFLQGRTVADVNVSLIGVDNQDRVFVGNAGYDTYIDSDTLINGALSAQTAFLTTTPTLNNSGTEILVRNSSTGEIEYRTVSGITSGTTSEIDTGNTLWVDQIFGNDGTATPDRQDLPYLTLSGALLASTSGDTIMVRPGNYSEEGLNVPNGVSMISEGGWEVTVMGPTPSSATDNIIELNENSYLEGFSINVPESTFNAVYATNALGTNTANNITFYGNGSTGSTGTAMFKTGGGKLIGYGIRVEGGGMKNALKVDSGVLALEGIHVPQSNGDIENVLLITTSGSSAGRAQMLSFNTGNNNVTNAVRLEGGSSGVIPTARIFTPNVFNATNAISSNGDYQSINFLGGSIENVTYAVNVDLTGTGVDASYRITSNHQPNYIYPPAVAYNADFGLDFQQESTDRFASSKNLFGTDRFGIGFAERGTEVFTGRGAPYGTGMVVLSTDNTTTPTTDGGNFIDISEEAKSRAGSTFTFQTGGTGTSILVTTTRISDDLTTPLKFFGIDMEVLSRTIGGSYTVEFWNGSEWEGDLYQVHSEDLGYLYGKTLFQRNQNKEHVVFGLDKDLEDTWVTKTINGTEGYWMRFRTTTSATTSPSFEQFELMSDSTFITKEGVIQFNGRSLYRQSINLVGGQWGQGTPTLSDYNVTVGSGTNPTETWNHEFPIAQFGTNGEAATFALKIPKGASTAQKIKVYTDYILNGTAADTTSANLVFSVLPVEVSNVLVADPDGGVVPTPRTVSATTAFNTYTAQTNSVSTDIGSDKMHSLNLGSFDISDYYSDDMLLMRLEKDAGTNVNLNLVNLFVDFDMWSLGSQTDPPQIQTETIFTEDWEDGGVSNNWQQAQNTAEDNLWVISSGTSRTGSNSAYVTNDSGGTNTYAYATNNTNAATHIYADFSIPANARSLTINFYWTCLGENGGSVNNWDFGRVGVAPTSFTPVAGTQFTDTYRVGALSNDNKFNEGYNGGASAGNWVEENIAVPTSLWTAGTDARLILQWRNDGSAGDQPPFAVDDITIDIDFFE